MRIQCTLNIVIQSATARKPVGNLYIYRISTVIVTVASNQKHLSPWCLIKVGVSKQDKVAKRLIGEGAHWRERKHTVKIPGAQNSPFAVPPFSKLSARDARDSLDESFINHCRQQAQFYMDLACIQKSDIGAEDQIANWPSGIGINVGKAYLSAPKNFVGSAFVFSSGYPKATTIRLFLRKEKIVPGVQSPTENWGESELVIIPNSHFNTIRKSWLTGIDIEDSLTEWTTIFNALQITSVKLSIPDHPSHPNFEFTKPPPEAERMWPPLQ
ncbi:MAG TPA: hypothetical protein VJ201_06760 [Candidatus Babeliales bacterium]|nr:hypothetical protein [Candidatus Babeliales bacterium]